MYDLRCLATWYATSKSSSCPTCRLPFAPESQCTAEEYTLIKDMPMILPTEFGVAAVRQDTQVAPAEQPLTVETILGLHYRPDPRWVSQTAALLNPIIYRQINGLPLSYHRLTACSRIMVDNILEALRWNGGLASQWVQITTAYMMVIIRDQGAAAVQRFSPELLTRLISAEHVRMAVRAREGQIPWIEENYWSGMLPAGRPRTGGSSTNGGGSRTCGCTTATAASRRPPSAGLTKKIAP